MLKQNPVFLFVLALVGYMLNSLVVAPASFPSLPNSVEAQTGECAGPSVCDATVFTSSRSPATRTQYVVTFVTPEKIEALTDSIIMVLDKDIRVPRAIARSQVRVQYRIERETGRESGNGTAFDVSLNDQDEPGRPTRVSIAHDVMANNSRVSIPVGATVTVTFLQSAGISNPSEGGSFSWEVGLGGGGTLVDANHPDGPVRHAFRDASGADTDSDIGLLVDREIQLSQEEISRGQSITVIARGYKNGHTLTVWRDANIDGRRDTSESMLCETVVGGNDTGRCSFTVYSPPFSGGFGECAEDSSLNPNPPKEWGIKRC